MPVINIEFTGGLETLFAGQRNLTLTVPEKGPAGEAYTIGDLIALLATEHVNQEKRDMFAFEDGVRPGILVLINETDWELEEETAYILQDKDNILFISTLHGG